MGSCYRKRKQKNNSIRRYFCIVLIFALIGCGKTDDTVLDEQVYSPKHTAEVAGDEKKLQEQPQAKQASVNSIAAKEWKIKEYPLAGTDNLYELPLTELTDSESWITVMKPFGNQFMVIRENEMTQTVLYLVNPLTAEITASCELQMGMYSEEGIRINDNQQIEILNLDTRELTVYNDKLQKVMHISMNDISADNIVLSADNQYTYYLDYTDGHLYRYQVETGTRTRIFADVECESDGFGRTIGLLNQDSCLAFCYSSQDTGGVVYEVRELETGSILYKDEAEITNIQNHENAYLFRHYEEGLLEILYGSDRDVIPQVLSLKDYEEYEQLTIDLQSRSVISCRMTEDVAEKYQMLAKEQGENALEEGQSVTQLTLNQYNLETGKRQYFMDFYCVQEVGQYVSNCRALYMPETECVICCLEGTKQCWLVWDLTQDSSRVQDEAEYLYRWQDPAHPDEEELKRLQIRAEQIGQQNGVVIHFGEEIQDCPKDIYDYRVTTNAIRIEKMLDLLEKTLAKYPEGMLAQLGKRQNIMTPLQIYLTGGITPNGEEGIPSIGIQNTLEDISFLVLDINSIGDLENTIYHELFHAIEKDINYSKEAFIDYEVWNGLNPEDFSYDYDYQVNAENYNYDYVVLGTEQEQEGYFLDIYSKSFPEEDRARIMEYAMLGVMDKRGRNIKCTHLQAKLKYICEQIRKGFDTTGWPERTSWEESLIE